jgi:hypothetical protein
MFIREDIKETLKGCIAKVTFEKSDGSMREMRCTLIDTYLPPLKVLAEGETPAVRKENLEVLSVWDVDNNGWRSFRIDSVQKFAIDTVFVFNKEVEA